MNKQSASPPAPRSVPSQAIIKTISRANQAPVKGFGAVVGTSCAQCRSPPDGDYSHKGDDHGTAYWHSLYGIVAYLVFFATFLYAIGFVAGIVVPKTIDTGPQAPLVDGADRQSRC